jgi:hypothetical protein
MDNVSDRSKFFHNRNAYILDVILCIKSLQPNDSPKHQTVENKSPALGPTSSTEVQLKYENDRLKLALAHR